MNRRAWLDPLAVGLAFVLLYWRTLQPDLVGHDAGEMQFVPYLFGIPHYTGYPLYLILGKLWTLLVPIGSVAWRMNLLSAMFGGVAAGLAYACGRELTRAWLGGLLAALITGLASLEWLWSTIAGVRSLAVAFVALAILAALSWERAIREGEVKLAERRFLGLAAIAGLGVDHHRTFVLLLPFLALYVGLTGWRAVAAPRLLAKAAGLFLLPLLLYGVLPLRAALGTPWDQWNTATWQGFVNVAIAGSESSAHLDLTPAQALGRVPELGQALLATFPALALAMAAVGLLVLAARRPALTLLLAGYTVVLAWLTVFWNVGGQLNLVYLMPAYVPIALFAAAGLFPPGGPKPRLGTTIGQAVLVAAVGAGGLYAGRVHFQPPAEVLDDFRQNLFEGHQARRLADALAILPPNGVVVADWDQATPLWYAQLVDGVNQSIAISYPASTLPDVLAKPSRPVFLATSTFHPPARMAVTAAGPYVQVLREPATSLPADVVILGGVFSQDVQLAGMAPFSQPGYGVLPITLYWRALRTPPADYHVSVRLVDAAGHVATQRDEAAPVLGLAPTSSWIAGQVTADYYELDLRALPVGAYDLAVVLYEPLPSGGFHNLEYDGAGQAMLGRLTLSADGTRFRPSA